jgi:hypothetical protein
MDVGDDDLDVLAGITFATAWVKMLGRSWSSRAAARPAALAAS